MLIANILVIYLQEKRFVFLFHRNIPVIIIFLSVYTFHYLLFIRSKRNEG